MSLRASPQFAKENLNVVAQFSDYVTPWEVDFVKEITRGSGAIVRRGLPSRRRAVLIARDLVGDASGPATFAREHSGVLPELVFFP